MPEIGISSNLISEVMDVTIDRVMEMQLLDISGRVVLSTKLRSGKSNIDVSTIPSGIYIVIFSENGKFVISKKVVVQR